MNDILETTETTIPVTFTDNALAEIKRILASDQTTPDSFLRVGVNGGGCAGMTYIMAFDKAAENDNQYLYQGVPMIMNKAHGMYLIGMQVDYQDGLNSRGFIFINPNAKSTCGCGTSFSV
ncbi:MAG: iron-sulfur cluster assembly accessory protein [Bacteroidetes bacterium]|nr:iron-sulfur cluster assembly accessory protein [Bacteroidota bacterium]